MASAIKSEVNMQIYRVKQDEKIDISELDPEDNRFFSGSKDEAESHIVELNKQLDTLQEILFAEHKHKVLIVLQAMDTGGKDGVIRHVFEGVNPQGVRVASFKVPSIDELDHDYLWRIHKQIPGKGEMVIFNRSHYEDVLVVRVHKIVPQEIWSRRYDQINDFERMLVDEGTTTLKFFLNISKDEQKGRLQDRLNQADKQWKFNVGDLKERELWDEYMHAYEEMLGKTSTEMCPWFIIPANHKWYRDLVIGSILVDTLKGLDMKYPVPAEDLSKIVIV
jgi:PPK2 family polyphosphate:nucleotide phosphotransferase